MALDPSIIAALSAGAKTTSASQDWDAWRASFGDRPGAWNLGQGIIDVLSTGGYATAGYTNKLGQNVAAMGRGEIGGFLDFLNPISGIAAAGKGIADRRTYSDNLKEMGVDEKAAVWLGLALDIGLDPTTYITGGTIAGAKAAAKGAQVAAVATKAGKVTAGRAAGEIATPLAGGTFKGTLAGAKPAGTFLPVGRELTQAEKLGNLLTGINQGYKTGKSTYKLSIKNNKLTRVSRKEAKKLDIVRGVSTIDSTFVTPKLAKAAEKVEKAATKAAEGMPEIINAKVVKLPNGKYTVEVSNAQGIITDWSKAGKEYSTKGNASKAAKAAQKEVEAAIAAGKTPTIQTNPASGLAADDIAVEATKAPEVDAAAAREREVLAEASNKQSALNKLAQTLTRPTAVRAVRDIDRTVEALRETVGKAKGKALEKAEAELAKAEADLAKFGDLKQNFLDRIEAFRDAEDAAVTASKIEKVTVEDLVKYINQSSKGARSSVMDELLATPVDIPANARSLRGTLAKQGADPDDAYIEDLIYLIDDAANPAPAINKATQIVDAAIAGAAKDSAFANPELVPWTDGVITAEDAGAAIRELVNFVYADLKKNSVAYKAIVKALEDAYFNRLKAVAGDAERALTADEVEAVFEAFLAGTDISKAINKIGAVDLAKIDPGTYDNITEVAQDLQQGKLTLSTAMKQDLAEILGIPRDNVEAALIKLADNVNGVSHLVDEAAAEGAELSRTPVEAGDAVTATGNSAGADVAAATERSFTPEAESAHLAMREEFARQLIAELQVLADFRGESVKLASLRIKQIVRENLTGAMIRQVEAVAEKAGKNFDEYIDEVLTKKIPFLVEDFEKVTDTGALKIDEFGTQARADIHNAVEDAKLYRKLYEGGKLEELATREAYMESAVENLLRTMGFVVRSTETKAAYLARGSKVGEYSSVTHADIMTMLVKQGKFELVAELRRPRGKFSSYKEGGIGHGNFLPTDIEDAWLAVQRLKENGADLAKGGDDFAEVRRILDSSWTVGGKTARDAQHVVTAKKLGGKEAKAINAAADELIEALVENYDALKAIHVSRESFVTAVVARNVWNPASELYLGMVKFAREYRAVKEAHKAGDLSRAEVTANLGELVKQYDDFLKQLSTGGFGDKDLAEAAANIIKNAFLAGKFAPRGGEQVLLAPVVKQAEDALRMVRAMDGAADAPAVKNARRKQKEKTISDDVAVTAEQFAKGAQEGNPPPVATEAADDAIGATVMANGAFAKVQTWWAKANKALNGNAIMGGALKTIIASSEQSAISYSHYFALGLKVVRDATKGQEAALMDAFKALQAYRKEVDTLIEAGDDIIEVDAFLAAYGKTVNREFFDLLDESFTMLLGNNNVFGAAKGLGIMVDELNRSLRQLGLADIQVGDEAIENFWHKVNPEKLPDQSPLEFLNLLNLAVHRAASRVEIASQLDYFVAKTPEQIKELGENIADYVKIDPNTNFGQLLGDTGKLIHKDDVEKVKAMWQYMESDSKFSDGALRRIVEVSDRITYVLKSTNTLIRPGHHVVSIVGEFAMNTLAGVRLSSYNNTARILNRFRPGQYENAGEPFKAYANLTAVKGKQIKASEFDTVYWISKDANGKLVKQIIPDELVYDLAERYGVLVHPGGSLEDFIVTGEAIIKGGYAKFHQGMNKIAVFASHRDNFFRLSHFIDELQKTAGAKSLEEAAEAAATAIREWHPTAGSLSAFEKKYMRRLVYFYTWQRVAVTKVIATMLEKPGIATIPSKIQYAFADANGFNPESFGDPWDNDGIYASWYTGSVFGPQFQGPAGEGDAWGIQPAFQPIDILGQMFKPFTLQPGQSPIDSMAQGVNDLFASNLNPLLKTVMESSAQSRLGTGGDLPSPTEYLINQVGFLNTLSKVSGIGQDPNPYETPQEKSEKDLRLWLNLLLGQRVTDYSTPASQYRWTIDQQETARRLAGQ